MEIEIRECFAKAVMCRDFRSESIKSSYELTDGKTDLGTVNFCFSVMKDNVNSTRHRHFFSESTSERNRCKKSQ